MIRQNFTVLPERELTSATWFVKDSDKDVLIPIEKKFATLVEDLYQRAVHEASLMGNGLDRLVQEKISVDEKYNIILQKSGDKLSFRKVPTGWFGKSWEIQRGYPDYTVEGEVEEEMLGPVKHV